MPAISTPEVIARNFDAAACLNPLRPDAKTPFNSERFNLLYVLLHERFNLTR